MFIIYSTTSRISNRFIKSSY